MEELNVQTTPEEITEEPVTRAADIADAAASVPEEKPVSEAAPAPENENIAEEDSAPAEPEETMEDYAAELEASFKKIYEGDILTGTVISVSETEVILDFGYYTDGIIHLEDASEDPHFSFKNNIEVGQTLSATVVRRDDGAGHILLSMKEAAAVLAWDKLKELFVSQENVTVKISEVTRGGAVAYLEGIRGFIPASKLALEYVEEESLKEYVNKSIDVRVITVDEEDQRLVMSAKEILREAAEKDRAKRVSNVEVGLVTEGTVDTLKPYGAFVTLSNGLSGLIHISQISQQRIKHPGAVLKEGQTVKVKIIDVKDGKISLSMKALEEITATQIEEEVFELPETEAATTSLASLFANIKL